MKKAFIAVLTAAALMTATVLPVSAGVKTAAAGAEDGQNPVMNYVGTYGMDRCTIQVGAEGAGDATVSVTWGSSASEHTEWEMSGPFDEATKTISYDNAVEKNVTFAEDGQIEKEEVVYENGKGSFTFEDTELGTTLTWNDETGHAADGMVFTNYLPEDAADLADSALDALTASSEAPFATSTDIENGILTISIDPQAAGGEFSWSYDAGTGEGNVELVTDTTEESGFAYVGSFRALKDGEDDIRLVFGNGTYVQQYVDFHVKAENGGITEVTEGAYTFPTLHDDLAPVLEGNWKEADGERYMTIALDGVDGFDVTVSDGSGRDGAQELYTFTAYYDAVEDALVYFDGTKVLAEITEEPEGEAAEKDGSGSGRIELQAAGDSETELNLLWTDDAAEGGSALFAREA